MSKCDLKIVLDRDGATYEPGEKVTGTVYVGVSEEVECQGLTLSLLWRTHGRGNRREGGERTLTLFRGHWQPGAQQSYRFELEAPPGPFTYRGHYLNIDWYLRARADIPWALDPKTECELLLHKGSYSGEVDFGPEYKPPQSQRQQLRRQSGCMVLMGLPFLLAGTGLTGLSVAGGLGGDLSAPMPFVMMGAVFALAGGFLLFTGLRNRLAQKKLGAVHVVLSATQLRPGDPLTATVRLRPPGELDVEAVQVKLQAQEVVVSGSGTNKTTHRHKAFTQELTLVKNLRVAPGQPVQWRAALELPPDAAPTFMADSNTLRWSVDVHVAIPGWPDWTQEFPLTVRP